MTSKTVAPVAVRSIDLLKFLANRGLISKLEKISTEPVNGIHLPIFMFRPCFKVQEALAAYGKSDDRMNDKEMWWMEYDDSYFSATLDKKTINSANYSAVERLINEGFGSYLVDIRYRVNSKDSVQSHRKVYRFMENDRIREIKAEEDAKSHELWVQRKNKQKEADEFLPSGFDSFQKQLEKTLPARLLNRSMKTAADVAAERKAKEEANAAKEAV